MQMAHPEVTGAIWVRLVFFLAHRLLTCMVLASEDPLVPELTDFRLLSDWFQAGFRPLCWPREQSKGHKKSPPLNMFDSLKISTAK